MKECFSFLNDSELVDEIVVKNTNLIADMCDEIKPIKDKLYPPKLITVLNYSKRWFLIKLTIGMEIHYHKLYLIDLKLN